jgi:hypothetical protein
VKLTNTAIRHRSIGHVGWSSGGKNPTYRYERRFLGLSTQLVGNCFITRWSRHNWPENTENGHLKIKTIKTHHYNDNITKCTFGGLKVGLFLSMHAVKGREWKGIEGLRIFHKYVYAWTSGCTCTYIAAIFCIQGRRIQKPWLHDIFHTDHPFEMITVGASRL